YYWNILWTLGDSRPFTSVSYRSRSVQELLSRLAVEERYDVLIADFLTMCINIPEKLPFPVVHFSHNVESMLWQRYVATERNPLQRIVFERERQRVERFEKNVINSYALTIAVSEADCEHFRTVYGGSRVGFVTTGVDTEYYAPGSSREEPGSIAFLGSMDWMPNIDAVTYFIQSIYPSVRRAVPEATFLIVGRSPTDAVRALAAHDPSIVVTGTLDDTRNCLAKAACAVVPIRVGGGTRIKIYELMAMGKAIISTTIGAEGLQYSNGDDIIIEDDPARFAQTLVKILRDDALRARIGKSARAHVETHCSWKAVGERFMSLLSTVKER
ncbi:MAG: glycosyltransferase family 4 protein, partial [Candidatus Krumholzibacteriia bacterium]